MPLETFNILIGAGTLILGIITVALILLYIILGKQSTFITTLLNHGVIVGFGIGLAAVVGSLTYSELYHLPPCLFCWWQRIFLYPQLILFGIAWYRKNIADGSLVFYYTTPLAIIGSLISLYHVILQQGIIGASGACLESGVSCTIIDIQVFGFLTIPMMALLLGIISSLLGILVLTHKKNA